MLVGFWQVTLMIEMLLVDKVLSLVLIAVASFDVVLAVVAIAWNDECDKDADADAVTRLWDAVSNYEFG